MSADLVTVLDGRGRAPDPTLAAINDQIGQMLEQGITDPSRIAGFLVDQLPADALRVVAVRGLRDLARQRISENRPARIGPGARPGNESPRWAAARTVDIPVPRPTGDWATLSQLTPDDLDELSRRYLVQARAHQRKGQLYGRLAFELRRGGFATVGEAPQRVVAAVFEEFGVPLPGGDA